MKRFLFIIIALTLFLLLATNIFAANYYVKNAGNDNNTGLSDAQAWATINKVRNAGLAINSCVYFKCGDTWNTRTDTTLRINWSGTNDANRAVIGAYYMDAGSETIGVNVNGKPIFDGGWDLETFESAARRYEILVQPYSVEYITVQNLKIINSHGYAVRSDSSAQCSEIHIKHIDVQDTGRASIDTRHMGNNALVEYCKVVGDNRQFFIGESAGWDSGIRARGDNAICRYCEVGAGWGEGIGVAPDVTSSNVLVENNLVWGRQSIGIYLGCCALDAIIRNNIVIGTTNTDYHKPWLYGGRTWNPAGIGFNQEIAGKHTYRNKIYGNVVIGCFAGIQSINKSEETVGYNNRQLVYNNTFIDNYYNINTHVNELMDTEYKNNISVIHTDAAAIGSKHVRRNQNVGPTSCYRPLGNFWSSTPQFSEWEHANDVIGDAKLFKTSGWQSISTPSDVDLAEAFALTTGSAAIDSAQDLGATYDDIFLEGTDFNVADASDASTPIVVVLGDQDSYGAGWEFGAVIWDLTISDASPSQNALGISITTDLNWTNPTGANNIDLLFDVKSAHDPPTTVRLNDQNVETWDCGTLVYNTEYAWRVDVNHAGGTETGTVYYFTTTSQANPPTPEESGIVWHKRGAKIVRHVKGLEIQ